MEDKIYILVWRTLSGEANDQEIKQVNEWIQKDSNRLVYHAIRENFYEKGRPYPDNRERVFRRIQKRLNHSDLTLQPQQQSEPSYKIWWKVAAVIAIAVGLSLFITETELTKNYTLTSNKSDYSWIEKHNPAGQKSSFELSDGTLVKLNSDSYLRFKKDFDGNLREVILEGEAFFDVKKDPLRPFVVRSGLVATTALGTSFNVRAYNDEPTVQVALVTGKVRVETASKATQDVKMTVLNPKQTVSYRIQSNELEEVPYDYERIVGWTSQTLYFKDADLDEIIKTLKRWYGVEFEIDNRELITTIFTGKFENKSLEYIMNVLSRDQQDFKFSIKDKRVFITKK